MKTTETTERVIKLIATNRRAKHDYEIIQTFEAGICLVGTEVKSLRQGKCSLQDAYIGFLNYNSNEVFLFNCHISPYSYGNRENHQPKRPRKLLLNRNEINKLRSALQEKGYTVVPLTMYFSGPFVKLEIALVKPKRKYDKRESTKERETKREIERKFKY